MSFETSARAADRMLAALAHVLPSDVIDTDVDVRVAYARDESEVEPTTPEAVLRPRDAADVSAIVAACHAHGVPLTARGAGTSRVGGATPCSGGIVVLTERMAGVKGIEVVDGFAVVGPGVVTAALDGLAAEHGLHYPPDPSSLATSTLGGNVASNAGGPRAVKYGTTRDYVLGAELVIGDGRRVRAGRLTRKGVTGYDLTSLFVGSEGTLGFASELVLRLVPRPESVATVIGFLAREHDIGPLVRALDVPAVAPSCIELLDRTTLTILGARAGLAVPRDAAALALVEVDGDVQHVERSLGRIEGVFASFGALEVIGATEPAPRARLWAARREMSRALRAEAKHKLSEDVVVPRSRLAELLASVRELGERHVVRTAAYGHAGDGNLHVNFLYDDDDERRRVFGAIDGLFRRVVELGGSLSGEHGIGLAKAPYLPLEQGPDLVALERRVKHAFDPAGIFNPGKIFGPNDVAAGASARPHGAC